MATECLTQLTFECDPIAIENWTHGVSLRQRVEGDLANITRRPALAPSFSRGPSVFCAKNLLAGAQYSCLATQLTGTGQNAWRLTRDTGAGPILAGGCHRDGRPALERLGEAGSGR